MTAPVGRRSEVYRRDGALELFAAALPPAPAEAIVHRYLGTEDVAGIRDAVRSFARSQQLRRDQIDSLILASSELATNSILHADGGGTLMMWCEPGSVVVQLSDSGHITDPLVGRRPPGSMATGGRGIYLAYQLCDLVQLRSSADGTTVRIQSWVP